jgi:ketosteroid isomerase-like protein
MKAVYHNHPKLCTQETRHMKTPLSALMLLAFAVSALADPEQQVRCREIAFSQSAESRDPVRFASFIDKDARFVGTTVTRGPEAVVTAWSAFFEAQGPAIRWRPQIVEVLSDGGLALSRGPYRVITQDEQGKQTEHWGTYNSVWRIQSNGDWRIVFDAGSPGSEPPTDEVRAVLEGDSACD